MIFFDGDKYFLDLRNSLKELILTEQENMTSEELDSCLQSLLGDEAMDIAGSMGPSKFSGEVLGFEDYVEDE